MKMKKFLRNQDVLGATPMMTYKKNVMFGTSIGGCCSLLANLFIGLYVLVQLVGFFVSPNYNLATKETYQPTSDPENYRVRATQVIPAFIIWNYDGEDPMEIFDVKWTRNGEFEAESSSINCREYMEKYLEGSQDKSVVYSFKGELYDMPEDYLCPDFSFFDLKGDSYEGVFFQM